MRILCCMAFRAFRVFRAIYNIPLLVFLITVLNEPLPMENATLFDQMLNECQEKLQSSFIQLSGVESHLKEGDLNLM